MKEFLPKSLVSYVVVGVAVLMTTGILASCSDYAGILDVPDSPNKQSTASSNDVDAEQTARLSFATIQDLESVTATDISEDLVDFELRSLEYECVDTIEMRALLFDVTAELISASNQEKTVKFMAEVGPELVSVEYYPCGEVIPPHDNFQISFHPKVERYRNYSDGSRIGPDEFYCDGHFINPSFSYSPPLLYMYTDLYQPAMYGSYNQYYSEGIYYCDLTSEIEFNSNGERISENGNHYFVDDLLPIYKEPGINSFEDTFIDLLNDPDGFYSIYAPRILYDMEDEVTYEAFNIGNNVLDASPKPFPTDTHQLAPGWYTRTLNDSMNAFNRYMSRYLYDVLGDNFYLENDDTNCLSFGFNGSNMISYLVIDGRIIHFYDYIDYGGIHGNQYTSDIFKEEDGYTIRNEVEYKTYGEKFILTYDFHIKLVDGPAIIVDDSNYASIENDDQSELSNLRTKSTRCSENVTDREILSTKDGMTMNINRNLPTSISDIKKYNKIKPIER